LIWRKVVKKKAFNVLITLAVLGSFTGSALAQQQAPNRQSEMLMKTVPDGPGAAPIHVNTATSNQNGNDNISLIEQVGYGNNAVVEQGTNGAEANNNKSTVLQHGHVVEGGWYNEAQVTQNDDNNEAFIDQTEEEMIAIVDQAAGGLNTVTNNVAEVIQRAFWLGYTFIHQRGNDLQAYVRQDDSAFAAITQQGEDMYGRIRQDHDGNGNTPYTTYSAADIDQSGSLNEALIEQAQDGNGAWVTQHGNGTGPDGIFELENEDLNPGDPAGSNLYGHGARGTNLVTVNQYGADSTATVSQFDGGSDNGGNTTLVSQGGSVENSLTSTQTGSLNIGILNQTGP
jgi:hypothetical protein